jgi:hypothetical protein
LLKESETCAWIEDWDQMNREPVPENGLKCNAFFLDVQQAVRHAWSECRLFFRPLFLLINK